MAALVIGIIGVLAGLIPLLFFVAWVLGVMAFVFGLVGRGAVRRNPARTGKGMATAGAILGVIAIGLGIVGIVIVANVFDDVDDALDEVGGVADVDTYELVENECTVDQVGVASLTGTITNTADDTRSYTIDVDFLDPAGTRLGNSSDLVDDLRPGADSAWKVTAVVDGATEVRCRVTSVENFFN